MIPSSKPNIENKAQGGLDTTLDSPGQLLTHDGSDLAVLPPGANGQVLTADSSAPLGLAWRGCSVPGFPGSSTDNAVVRFDGTSGNVVQNSSVLVDDDGNVYQPGGKAIQWGSDVKLYHSGSGLVLGSAFNGDPSLTEFTAGKVWTNEVYTPSIESNVALRVRAGGIGMWLSSGNLIVDNNLSVKQDAEVEGELRANIGTISTLSTTNATIDTLNATTSSLNTVSADTVNANTILATGTVIADAINTNTIQATGSVDASTVNTNTVNATGIVDADMVNANTINATGSVDADTVNANTVGSSNLTATNATFTNPISSPNFPSTATDNAVVRFDGTGGNVVQDSVVTIADDGTITTPAGISARNLNLVHVDGVQTAFSVGINGDPFPHGRFAVLADGSVRWGNGVFLDVQLRRSAARTLLLDGVTGPATLALANGSFITWSGSPSSSNTINLNGGQVYAGTLNIAPNGSLAWKDTGSGNGGTLVNTGNGQWELQTSAGDTAGSQLKVGLVDGLVSTTWLYDSTVTDTNGVMPGTCGLRLTRLQDKILRFEIAGKTFTAATNGVVRFLVGFSSDLWDTSFAYPILVDNAWGTIRFFQSGSPFLQKFLVISPTPGGSFTVSSTYTWASTSFTVSLV